MDRRPFSPRMTSARAALSAAGSLALVAVLALPGGAQLRTASLSSSSASTWEAPRTPWGHPDIQGNWTNATLTPFVRPAGWGPVLTDTEVREIEEGQADLVARAAEATDPDRAPPEAGGTNPICIDSPTSCYNEVYREPGTRVAVVGGEARSSLLTFPADGRVPALTPDGRERLDLYRARNSEFDEFDHPELRPLAERCIISFGSSAGPPMLPNYWYNNNYTIVQNAGHVMIMAEMVHDVRIIRLGEPQPLPDHMQPYFGDSWGHWEGNALVVETTNINPAQAFRGIPSSPEGKVIERFTRVSETTVLYEFMIDDPGTYSEAWGGQIPFNRFEDDLYEYACHEGNYALPNVLSGARYQEREGNRQR